MGACGQSLLIASIVSVSQDVEFGTKSENGEEIWGI